ncbi:hypothetical protein V8B55DRAFT_1042034 [Mucor lusitanicus]
MPTTKEQYCIYIMLSSIFINTKREPVRKSNNVKLKYTQSEIDYIMEPAQSTEISVLCTVLLIYNQACFWHLAEYFLNGSCIIH